MAYERLVGLQVTNEGMYSQYRAAMGPILAEYGGGFRYDFQVATVLKAATPQPINRVFILRFPDAATETQFFADARYLKVRAEFFEKSVGAVTILAGYQVS